MDDLRDYRFYNDDMLHPSDTAINYIWEAFSGCYFENKTIKTYSEVVKITKACNHRFNSDSPSKKQDFAKIMLKRISRLEADVPTIDLSFEKSYFQNLL
jgi:hypothetical protein